MRRVKVNAANLDFNALFQQTKLVLFVQAIVIIMCRDKRNSALVDLRDSLVTR